MARGSKGLVEQQQAVVVCGFADRIKSFSLFTESAERYCALLLYGEVSVDTVTGAYFRRSRRNKDSALKKQEGKTDTLSEYGFSAAVRNCQYLNSFSVSKFNIIAYDIFIYLVLQLAYGKLDIVKVPDMRVVCGVFT